MNLYPFQIHSIALSTFASLIGPFGGFFASGFKRAFKIKVSSQSVEVTHKPLNLCLYAVFTYLEWPLHCELVPFHFIGLCGHYSWPWWNNGSFWLSVSDGDVRSCLHSKFYQVRKSGDLLTHLLLIYSCERIFPIKIHKINETGTMTIQIIELNRSELNTGSRINKPSAKCV